MPSGGPDWGRISAIIGIIASLGGVAGFVFSPDTQRCTGLRGDYRGHFLRALRHCTDERAQVVPSGVPASISSSSADAPPADDPSDADPRKLAGTHWVFYDGQNKTYAIFGVDGIVTFSDPAYGSGGTWELAGSRGVAFHTDEFEFGGTIGRGIPDSFIVSYRHLPRGSAIEPEKTATFTRVNL